MQNEPLHTFTAQHSIVLSFYEKTSGAFKPFSDLMRISVEGKLLQVQFEMSVEHKM